MTLVWSGVGRTLLPEQSCMSSSKSSSSSSSRRPGAQSWAGTMQLLTLTAGLGLLSLVGAMMPPLSPATTEKVMVLERGTEDRNCLPRSELGLGVSQAC